MEEWEDPPGPLQPRHIREAYRRLKQTNVVPSPMRYTKRLFRKWRMHMCVLFYIYLWHHCLGSLYNTIMYNSQQFLIPVQKKKGFINLSQTTIWCCCCLGGCCCKSGCASRLKPSHKKGKEKSPTLPCIVPSHRWRPEWSNGQMIRLIRDKKMRKMYASWNLPSIGLMSGKMKSNHWQTTPRMVPTISTGATPYMPDAMIRNEVTRGGMMSKSADRRTSFSPTTIQAWISIILSCIMTNQRRMGQEEHRVVSYSWWCEALRNVAANPPASLWREDLCWEQSRRCTTRPRWRSAQAQAQHSKSSADPSRPSKETSKHSNPK